MVKPPVPSGSAQGGDSPPTADTRDHSAWNDAALLARYIAGGDQEAFAQIASRHGAMVFRTCLRQLGNVHDAEDATQAVFLVLARQPRKAQESLAGWLHKVAHDTAITLLRAKSRRARREEVVAMRNTTPTTDATDGLREELDSAIARLPTKLRAPVILCYLEGHRQEDVARMLGCNQGTLSRRAADGLNLLRSLLAHRGVVVTAGVLAAYLAQQQAQATAPAAALLGSLKFAAGGKVAGALSAQAGAIADATLKAAALAKVKLAAVVVAAATVIGAGAGVIALRGEPEPARMVLVNFDGATLPVNKVGAGYPSCCPDAAGADGGSHFTTSLNSAGVSGSCLQMQLTRGLFKAQFDPDERNRKTFARDYVADPAAWRFNTYNRLRFWIKLPTGARTQPVTNGNVAVGAYVKRVADADPTSLDAGGGAFYYALNVPATGHWTQVVLNMHPSDRIGRVSSTDLGNQPHPTNEEAYNLFDAMTRFFIEDRAAPASYPADYFLDEMEFTAAPGRENDEQVYGLTATHVPGTGRVIVTWNRPKNEGDVKHQVRFAFRSIHALGWQAAQAAPDGVVRPVRENSGMIYDSTELPLQGQKTLYIAIKPENSDIFSQIVIPLTLK